MSPFGGEEGAPGEDQEESWMTDSDEALSMEGYDDDLNEPVAAHKDEKYDGHSKQRRQRPKRVSGTWLFPIVLLVCSLAGLAVLNFGWTFAATFGL